MLFALSILITSCDEKKIIYIADTFADCQGVSARKCMQIKENKEDDWTYFYNKIEGFQYEEGISYQIEVSIRKVENPPADGSSLEYKLVRIINQEVSTPKNTTFSTLSGHWKVISIKDLDSLSVNPTLKFDIDAHKIAGKSGCNSYGASFTQQDNSIVFYDLFSTKMMCSNMAIEKAYFESLSNIKTYNLLGDKLTFYDANNAELISCAKL